MKGVSPSAGTHRAYERRGWTRSYTGAGCLLGHLILAVARGRSVVPARPAPAPTRVIIARFLLIVCSFGLCAGLFGFRSLLLSPDLPFSRRLVSEDGQSLFSPRGTLREPGRLAAG